MTPAERAARPSASAPVPAARIAASSNLRKPEVHLDVHRRPWRRLRGGALVVTLARLVHLMGALARPAAAGTGAVPGGAELVGHFRPGEAGAAVLDDGRKRFLLALVPCPAPVDELEPVGRHPAGGAAG